MKTRTMARRRRGTRRMALVGGVWSECCAAAQAEDEDQEDGEDEEGDEEDDRADNEKEAEYGSEGELL